MNDQFENYAREQINGYEAEIDAEAMWDDIAPVVTGKKNKRKFFWIFFFGLGICLISFGTFYWIQNTQNETTFASSQSNDLAVIENTDFNNKSKLDKSTNDAPIEVINEKKAQIRPQNQSNFYPNVQTVVKPENLRETLVLPISKIKNRQVTISERPVNDTLIHQVDNLYSASNADVSNKGLSIDISQILTSSPLQLTVEAESISNQIEDTLMTANVWNTPMEIVLDVPLEFLRYDVYSGLEKSMNTIGVYKQNTESWQSESITSSKKPIIGLGSYIGFSHSTYHLAAIDSFSEQYITARKNTEEQRETFHIGLSAIMLNKRNFHFRTGVEYTVMNRLFSTNQAFTSIDSIVGIKEIRVNTLTGDSIFVSGSILTSTIIQHNKKLYNYTYIIDVPLIVGYHFEKGSWDFGLEAGVHANILVKHEGEILVPGQSFYDKETDDEKWYKNIGIRPYFGLTAAYRLSDHLQLQVSPSVLLNATFSSANNPIKEKSSSYGMKIGVQYFFNSH